MSRAGRDREPSLVIKTNITGPGTAPACPPQMMLAAAADVEWSKNYRARNGNVPFCYSVTWLAVPADGSIAGTDAVRFWYRSAYVRDASQTASLVTSAGEILAGLLAHAGLAAHYREHGIHVATVEEPARASPFIEEIVVRDKGQFDVECEAGLFAAQLSAQLRAARQHTMIICDKTIANVLAYAWLVLPAPPGSREAAVLQAMEGFCRAWAGVYDARVLLLRPVQPAPGRRPLPGQGTGPAARRRPGRPLHVRHRRPARHRHPARPDHRRPDPVDHRPHHQARPYSRGLNRVSSGSRARS
jgi:hypothetical protein